MSELRPHLPDVGASSLAIRRSISATKVLPRVTRPAFCGVKSSPMIVRKRTPTKSLVSKRGFTLVEVIVAIVIAALCLSALAGVFSGGMRAASVGSELARAAALAQTLIASAGVERPLTDGEEAGTSADGLAWSLVIADESNPEDEGPVKPTLILKRITARVTVPNPAQPERARSFELSSLRAAPRPVLQ